MSYSTEKLPDLPVVLATLHSDYDHAQEGEAAYAEEIAMLDAQSEPVYYILDIKEYSPTLDVIISGTNWGGKQGNMPTVRHPNVVKPIVISQSDIVKLAVKGVKTVTWGYTDIKVFETLDEALDYVRLEISS